VISFTLSPEPQEFDEKVRQPGIASRIRSSPGRFTDHWKECKGELADAFRNLCAYSAMYEPVGTVDHYLSTNTHPELTYEWSNYRYASAWINSSKQNDRVLDPFHVEDGWFEILLPSLQLVLTNSVPAEQQALAEYTLIRLHLRDDERVVRQRREWYRMYQDGELLLVNLEKKAPLIARAIRKQLESAGGV
jgi:hypothetical protein